MVINYILIYLKTKIKKYYLFYYKNGNLVLYQFTLTCNF